MEIIVINITLLVSRLRKVKPKEMSSSLICLKKNKTKQNRNAFVPSTNRQVHNSAVSSQTSKERENSALLPL